MGILGHYYGCQPVLVRANKYHESGSGVAIIKTVILNKYAFDKGTWSVYDLRGENSHNFIALEFY